MQVTTNKYSTSPVQVYRLLYSYLNWMDAVSHKSQKLHVRCNIHHQPPCHRLRVIKSLFQKKKKARREGKSAGACTQMEI